jgi:RNA polymerase sigma factor (sigma-70 family)
VAHFRDGTALRHGRALFNVGTMAGLADAQVLDRCTFLVLVRNARSIRNQGSIVSWLHGAAIRVASCQRGATARRRRHEQKAAERATLSVDDEPEDDVRPVIHKELDRLPEKYRAPILLCYFESLSHEEAARLLHWPVGTVRSRLARGRARLRGRLVKRGLAPSCVLLERVFSAETARGAISTALVTATARAARQYASARFAATSVSSTSVILLMEGAMKGTFVANMKLAALACGLIAASAVVVAQQAGTTVPDGKIPAGLVGESENRGASSSTLGDDDAAVARELGRLDIDLLAEEVIQLRTAFEAAVRNKLLADKKDPGLTGKAQKSFESVRAEYLAKARDLRAAQRRLGNAPERRELGRDLSPGLSKPSDQPVVRDVPANKPGSHPAAAAIGSIDMDAVFQRYEKVKLSSKEYNDELLARKNELMRIMTEAQEEARMLPKLVPGSADYKKHEDRITELKARHEAGREQSEHEFAQRQARMTANLLQEIQEVVADLAKAKGLNYVVKVSPGRQQNPAPSDVMTAVNRSVVYADPRNDVTEEVVGELNRKLTASAAEKSRK